MKIAKIIIDQKNKRLDRPYDYLVPDEARAGMRTVQYFGRGKRLTRGFICQIVPDSSYESSLKEIEEILDDQPVLTNEQIQLCMWIRQSSFSLYWEILHYFTAWTPLEKRKDRLVAYRLAEEVWLSENPKNLPVKAGPVMEDILRFLSVGPVAYRDLRQAIPNALPSLKKMIQRDWVRVERRPSERLCEQFIPQNEPRPDSVGLGRTEPVYRECAGFEAQLEALQGILEAAVSSGRQIMIIAPTVEVLERTGAFLEERTRIAPSVCHGGLGREERYAFSDNFRNGRSRVALATASGLMIPYGQEPPVVVVLEAGDSAYHLPGSITLNVLAIARKLHDLTGAPLFYLDSLPSVQARQSVLDLQWQADALSGEEDDICTVVHMERELREGNRSVVSRALRRQMEKTLADGKQTLLLLNRSGYSRHVFCRDCGYTFTCPDCGMALQTDRDGKVLFCRNCSHREDKPPACPDCGSPNIRANGLGINRAVQVVRNLFPDAAVSLYPDTQGQIVLGTKAITGCALSGKVGCIGALLADLDIDFPDYRASEEAYRMYRSFFRRARDQGGLSPDQIFLQTYHQENETVRAICGKHEAFFSEQLVSRRLSKLPPFGHVYAFTLRAGNRESCLREAQILRERIEKRAKEQVSVFPVFTLRNQPGRCRFLVKSQDDAFMQTLWQMIAEGEIEALQAKVAINVDPPNLI